MGSDFVLDLTKFVEKAKGNADLVVRKAAADIAKRVIERTPVDTGRARGNWMAAVGKYSPDLTGSLDKDGAATVANVTATLDKITAGTVVYLTNTLPYILELENGSSKQAPSGMVQATLREWPDVVQVNASGVS